MTDDEAPCSFILNIYSSKHKVVKPKESVPASLDEKSKYDLKANKRKQASDSTPLKRTNTVNSAKKFNGKQSSSLFSKNEVAAPLIVEKKGTVSEPLFSKKSFEDLNIHPRLVSCLKDRLNINKPTSIQERTIPVLLNGQDALVKSCTGSGKTLCYAVPIVQKLKELDANISRSDGVLALIIVPTRELALQCYECISKLTQAFIRIVPGYLIGGEKKHSEKNRLRKGINILISTPGRLLDHLDRTACLSLDKIGWLVIDEADRLLEDGFKQSVIQIVRKCCKERQSVLLSATLSKELEYLAGISLSNPVHINLGSPSGSTEIQGLAVPKSLKQYVVVVPAKQRLVILSGFIISKCLEGHFKCLVFLSSQNSVDYHYLLISSVLGPELAKKGHKCKFMKLHGSMTQEERTEIFKQFKAVKEGVLFCTDVAARGLDMPKVDWIVQYTAPPSAEIYVHRIGRTARIGNAGNSLLCLLPSENKFATLLTENKLVFEETESTKFLESLLLLSDTLSPRAKPSVEMCATAMQTKYENAVYEEEDVHQMAKSAFASYIQAYATYPTNVKASLPFHELHLGHIAKSFCLREAPSKLNRYPRTKNSEYKFKADSKHFGKSRPMNSGHKFKATSKPGGKSRPMNSDQKFKAPSKPGGGPRPMNSGYNNFTRSERASSPPVTRKFSTFSEFDSGLPPLKAGGKGKPPKRRNYDSD